MNAALPIPVKRHVEQRRDWPAEGEHVLAHHDDDSIIVYQAYRPSTGRFAVKNGRLGGPDFSFNRMSWVKPNFLWMMYRSGWGTKPGQEVTLALRVRRRFFDALLADAVPASFDPARYASHGDWQVAVAASEVRVQWDPDHAPSGAPLARRAIQLGLRGSRLAALAGDELLEVIDFSAFVAEQRPHAQDDDDPRLLTPEEQVYLPAA